MSPGGSESLTGDGPGGARFTYWCAGCQHILSSKKRQHRCDCGDVLTSTIPNHPQGGHWPVKTL